MLLLLLVVFQVSLSSSTFTEKEKHYNYPKKNRIPRGWETWDEDDIKHDLEKLTIPERFDSREKWPNCPSIQTIVDLGHCTYGSWAYASATVMSDRFCISSGGAYNGFLSIQDLLECCTECVPSAEYHKGGCYGAVRDGLERSFDFWKEHGIVTGTPNLNHLNEEGCKPEHKENKNNDPVKICRTECSNLEYNISYEDDKKFSIQTIHNYYQAGLTDLRHIQAEIMLNGPVAVDMAVDDKYEKIPPGTIFQSDEIFDYDHDSHYIRMLGWDVIGGIPVWIISDSWGTEWCDKGYCHVRRGKNDYLVEHNRHIMAGIITDGRKPPRPTPILTTEPFKWNTSGSRKAYFEYFLKFIFMLYLDCIF